MLACTEINASFGRPHRRAVHGRWSDASGDGFAFCVKAPKTSSHAAHLSDVREPLTRFPAQADGLGRKLAAIGVRLPPSLAYAVTPAGEFSNF